MTAPLPWTPVKVGWLSGVSRPGTCALSPEQRAFVAGLRAPEEWKLRTNFPYGGRAEAFRRTPLPFAMAVNLIRFLGASQPLRRPRSRRAWAALKHSCDRLLLVTSSCGSQMVAALERAAPEGAAVALFTLGAVDLGARALDVERAVGGDDGIARPRKGARVLPGVGHMGYARSAAALEEVNRWLDERLAGQP